MRMPKPGKAEIIMMFLNQWDPAHGAHKDYRFYRVEAEEGDSAKDPEEQQAGDS